MRKGPPPQAAWGRRSIATVSRVGRSRSRHSSICSSGLWSMHSPRPPVRATLARSHAPSAAAHDEKHAPTGESLPLSKAATTLAGAPSTTHFTLDPPFARVKGEAERAPGHCLYTCRFCCAIVFRSCHFADTSRVGRHESGWPTFVAPSTPSALRLKTVLQRSLVARLSDASLSKSANDTPDGLTKQRRELDIAVPHISVAQRGLAVEGDLVRRRGSPVSVQETRTWREACLRDENHRADPALVLGICSACGTPLCHVTQSAAEGTRYISTAACIEAQPETANRSG
ncbi:hypothetical protein LSCM1_08226 [Leishmania martiniquensis]|uniref:Uncharacterized protein n=1 Tax=Leishmania martiniquensis TaxID=1580590 RepID=A0A836KUW2_9TRYP|nr:hypothetical protein LSCM1_08226 [Leishmania martiniquensis]